MMASAPQVDCVLDPAGRWRVTLAGEIDELALPRLDEVAEKITGADPADVFVDLTKVTLLLSAGLGFLARLRAHATTGGYAVTLCRPAAVALRALQVIGFDRVFPITVGVLREDMLVMSDERPAALPPGSGSPDTLGELPAVRVGMRRWAAARVSVEAAETDLVRRVARARAAAEAAETDLVRQVAQARAAGVPVESICELVLQFGVPAEGLPRGLRVALGYKVDPDTSERA